MSINSDFLRALEEAFLRKTITAFGKLSPAQFLLFRHGVPNTLVAKPVPLLYGDSERGEELLDGRFIFAGKILDVGPDGEPWTRSAPSRRFAEYLHSFNWLADLAALQSAAGIQKARALIDGWIAVYGKGNTFAWHAPVLIQRVIAWLSHAGLILDGDEGKADSQRCKALLRQGYALNSFAVLRARNGQTRLQAGIALTLCGLCLPKSIHWLDKGIDQLEEENIRQTLEDGGYTSRNPEYMLSVLSWFILVEQTMSVRNLEPPGFIRRVVDRLSSLVRLFNCSDGGLSAFHGGGEGNKRFLNAVLAQTHVTEPPLAYLPQTGFQKVKAGNSTLIMDVGGVRNFDMSESIHMSALAFEFSADASRIFVNCGWSDDLGETWREAARSTAAHSTVVFQETSSGQVLKPGLRRYFLGPRLCQIPSVKVKRKEEDRGIWIEAHHDGYLQAFGLLHKRRVYLSQDGENLRGEDRFLPLQQHQGRKKHPVKVPYTLRFHLHPRVRVSMARDGRSALIVLPNGDGWRFRSDAGPANLKASVYLAAGTPPQRTEQIVFTATADTSVSPEHPCNRVRWALQKLGAIKARP